MQCQPLKEKCEEGEESAWQCYLSCGFDLSKAKVVPIKNEKLANISDEESPSLIPKKERVGLVPVRADADMPEKFIQGEGRMLLLTIVPSDCDDILIRGRSRVLKCDESPQVLTIFPDDTEIIVRLRGYKPRHIQLNSSRVPSNINQMESLSVFLEKI